MASSVPRPTARGGGKAPGFASMRRLMGAKLREFEIVQKFLHGYRSREDVTTLPPGVLSPGSQNVLTNTFQRVGIRQGYVLDGQRDTSTAGITASFDWERQAIQVRHLRAGFNTTGTNGKLQYRYVAAAGDRWMGNIFTAGQVFWIDLLTGVTNTNYNFASFFDSVTEQIDELLFVNGASQINMWSGGVTTLASASNASGVISVLGATATIGGTGYTLGDTLTITGGGGTGATATVASFALGAIATLNSVPTSGGSPTYAINDVLTITGSGGTGGTCKVTGVSVGVVTSVVLVTSGTGYNTGTGLATTGGGGTGCTINITAVTNTAVGSVVLVTPGTGYSTGTSNATTGGSGSGATLAITTVVTGYIQKTGTTTWAQEGFLAHGTRSVSINGNVYPYTGGESSLYLVGISPSAAAEPAQSVIHQTVRVTTNAALTSFPATYQEALISVLNNQVYLGAFNTQIVFISQVNDYTNYSFTSPNRKPGEGFKLTLDGVPTAFIPQLNDMYVTAGLDYWYQSVFTLSADLTSESFAFTRIKTSALQAAQSQALVTKFKNVIAFISNEPTLDTLGTQQNFLNDPQIDDVATSIVNDMRQYNFTGGAVVYWRKFVYVSVPTQGLVLPYNMTDLKNPYWEAPQVLPISRWSIIDGLLYGHSFQSSNTFKMFSGYSDDGHPVAAAAVFSFEDLGIRTSRKSFNSYYAEGYISSNSTLNLNLQYDMGGDSTSTTFPIFGTDTAIVPPPADDVSLGTTPLGTVPLGGSGTIVSPIATPPKFRVEKTFNRVPHFEYQPSFSSYGVGQQWEILAFGPASSPTSEEPTDIRE